MTKVTRPWGEFEVLHANAHYWTKMLWIHPRQSTSLQWHEYRDELWIPLTSGIRAVVGDKTLDLEPWMNYDVCAGTPHRLTNIANTLTVLVEIATGHPDESDIIRIHDKYGRV